MTVMLEIGGFIKVIQPNTLKKGNIEFPQAFLNKHRKNLPKNAQLEVPTGAMWEVELKSNRGRVWLHRGLQVFAKHCSIKPGYVVAFRYDIDQPKDEGVPEKATPKKLVKVADAKTDKPFKSNKPRFMDRVHRIFLCGS